MSAADVLDVLVRRGETLAVAESLTGGLLAATIVDVPGASRAFRGGVVAYATELKVVLAGVPVELLDKCGPVHPETAAAMAYGIRKRCQADWGLATTGVAGPDPQDGIPVGTVYVALSGARSVIRRRNLTGDRATIRTGTVDAALDLLATTLRAYMIT